MANPAGEKDIDISSTSETSEVSFDGSSTQKSELQNGPSVVGTSSIQEGQSEVESDTQLTARQNFEENLKRVPLGMLEDKYVLPLKEVAEQLGVSLTMMKQICRHYKIRRWPHRQMKSIMKSINQLQDKLKMVGDGSPEAADILRQLQLTEQKKALIVKMASRGLNSEERSLLFLSNPGELNQLLTADTAPESEGQTPPVQGVEVVKGETIPFPSLSLQPSIADENKYIEMYGMKMHPNLASQFLMHQPVLKKQKVESASLSQGIISNTEVAQLESLLSQPLPIPQLQPTTLTSLPMTVPNFAIGSNGVASAPSVANISNAPSFSASNYNSNLLQLGLGYPPSSSIPGLPQQPSYLSLNAPLSTLLNYANIPEVPWPNSSLPLTIPNADLRTAAPPEQLKQSGSSAAVNIIHQNMSSNSVDPLSSYALLSAVQGQDANAITQHSVSDDLQRTAPALKADASMPTILPDTSVELMNLSTLVMSPHSVFPATVIDPLQPGFHISSLEAMNKAPEGSVPLNLGINPSCQIPKDSGNSLLK